jgi:hypothetical protein
MKNKIKFLAILTVSVMIASCEKEVDPPEPSCNIVCMNGGTVTSNCGCACPSGFTGTNCQTSLNNSQMVTVNLNPGTYHQILPIKTNGDNEFDGQVYVTINVTLEISSDRRKIHAVNELLFYEPGGDHTTARIIPGNSASKILLYTAPAGKKIDFINSSTQINYGPHLIQNYHGTTFINNLNASNHFLHKIEFIADTQGNDLPANGTTSYSRYRIYFDDFQVAISDL